MLPPPPPPVEPPLVVPPTLPPVVAPPDVPPVVPPPDVPPVVPPPEVPPVVPPPDVPPVVPPPEVPPVVPPPEVPPVVPPPDVPPVVPPPEVPPPVVVPPVVVPPVVPPVEPPADVPPPVEPTSTPVNPLRSPPAEQFRIVVQSASVSEVLAVTGADPPPHPYKDRAARLKKDTANNEDFDANFMSIRDSNRSDAPVCLWLRHKIHTKESQIEEIRFPTSLPRSTGTPGPEISDRDHPCEETPPAVR